MADSKVVVERSGATLHVKQARVQDVIDMIEAEHDRSRASLIADLEAAGMSGEEKMLALEKLRAEKGLIGNLVRGAFTLDGAVRIIKHQGESDDIDELLNATPDEVITLALQVIGYDLDADNEKEKAEDDENPT